MLEGYVRVVVDSLRHAHRAAIVHGCARHPTLRVWRLRVHLRSKRARRCLRRGLEDAWLHSHRTLQCGHRRIRRRMQGRRRDHPRFVTTVGRHLAWDRLRRILVAPSNLVHARSRRCPRLVDVMVREDGLAVGRWRLQRRVGRRCRRGSASTVLLGIGCLGRPASGRDTHRRVGPRSMRKRRHALMRVVRRRRWRGGCVLPRSSSGGWGRERSSRRRRRWRCSYAAVQADSLHALLHAPSVVSNGQSRAHAVEIGSFQAQAVVDLARPLTLGERQDDGRRKVVAVGGGSWAAPLHSTSVAKRPRRRRW